MEKITLQHTIGNKILEYDVDDRGVIIDEREKDRDVKIDTKEQLIEKFISNHMAFRYDTKGYTNEVLSQTKQLEDLSGNNRPMLLNNLLFDMMSGMDGYNNSTFKESSIYNNERWEITNGGRTIQGIPEHNMYQSFNYVVDDVTNKVIRINWHIEGIKDGDGVYVCQYTQYNVKTKLSNGDNYIEIDISDSPFDYRSVCITTEDKYTTNITITQIPEYPGALVTDGVDDYGVVQNMTHGVKMLFMTVNPMALDAALYDQRFTSGWHFFAVIAESNKVAYNSYNTKGKTYINGTLNESQISNELQNEKQIITIVNSNVNETNPLSPYFFKIRGGGLRMKCAFYNSIGFDSIPTEEDGFTEQELIDYVIEKYELNKI